MAILQFYGRLLSKTPDAFRGAWEAVYWIVAVFLVSVAAMNAPLGKRLNAQWDGISPWWTLAVVAAFSSVRVAVNNYEAFAALQKRVTTDETRTARRRHIREGLSDLIAKAKFYERCCLDREEPVNLGEQVKVFGKNAQRFLEFQLDDESFLNLFLMANEHDVQLTKADFEHIAFENEGSNYQGWLKTLRAQRKVLERCLKEYPLL